MECPAKGTYARGAIREKRRAGSRKKRSAQCGRERRSGTRDAERMSSGVVVSSERPPSSHHLAPHLEVEVVQRGLQQVRVVGVGACEGHEGGPRGRAPLGRGALGETLGGDAEHRAWGCAANERVDQRQVMLTRKVATDNKQSSWRPDRVRIMCRQSTQMPHLYLVSRHSRLRRVGDRHGPRGVRGAGRACRRAESSREPRRAPPPVASAASVFALGRRLDDPRVRLGRKRAKRRHDLGGAERVGRGGGRARLRRADRAVPQGRLAGRRREDEGIYARVRALRAVPHQLPPPERIRGGRARASRGFPARAGHAARRVRASARRGRGHGCLDHARPGRSRCARRAPRVERGDAGEQAALETRGAHHRDRGARLSRGRRAASNDAAAGFGGSAGAPRGSTCPSRWRSGRPR